jgi:hypothetical protein
MTKLAYLMAMALLGIGLTLAQSAQSTKPSSDQSNSSTPAGQAPSGSSSPDEAQPAPHRHHRKGEPSQSNVPDTTVRDQQSSTTWTTGVAGQDSSQAPTSKMGTTGDTPATGERSPEDKRQTVPQNANPTDQQPNTTSSPNAPSPQARLLQTPGARAAATHTPDAGTCMNPAALEIPQNGAGGHPDSHCN